MTANNRPPTSESDLPAGLSAPARRALDGVGIVRLEQLTTHTEAEILKLRGMGPNALEKLRRALAARGLSFRHNGQGATKL